MIRILVLFLTLSFAFAYAQDDGRSESDRLYRESMSAYLAGEYDPAILLAAQAVQTDATSTKARDFLSVLIAEKTRMMDSEVWLSRPAVPHPVTVQAPSAPQTVDLDPIREEMQMIRMEFNVLRKNRTGEQSMALARELERRVQVMASLMEKNSTERFDGIRNDQAGLRKEISSTRKWGIAFGIVVFVLSLASLAMSYLAFVRKPHGGHARH